MIIHLFLGKNLPGTLLLQLPLLLKIHKNFLPPVNLGCNQCIYFMTKNYKNQISLKIPKRYQLLLLFQQPRLFENTVWISEMNK